LVVLQKSRDALKFYGNKNGKRKERFKTIKARPHHTAQLFTLA